ncbi:MAG: hypothetical protein E6H69_08815 [Betaproteobacteria bacterium]|nr:MAG: hypothetical protein E6H69_08815 [Betaproteobacteria bacterium]
MTKAAALVALILLPAMLGAGLARGANTNSAVAALVMDLTGATKPPLVVHREVAPGTKIAVAPGARLSLLHYATCSIVTFSGGTVKVTEEGAGNPDRARARTRFPLPVPALSAEALCRVGYRTISRNTPR